MQLETTIRASAFAAVVVVLGMIAIFFVTGVGQDPLQAVHGSDDYLALLLKNPPALRACIGLDNFFIVFYGTLFTALCALLWRAGTSRVLLVIATSLLLSLAVLDMIENFHFLVMLASAELGAAPTSTE